MYIDYDDLKDLSIGIFLTMISSNCAVFNYILSIYICDSMKIPYDFALTIMSGGFAFNLTVVLTVIEVVVICVVMRFIIKKMNFNM